MMGAISAIDIALWYIAGKYYNVPIHKLLGGKTRNRARCYIHVKGNSLEKLVQGCKEAKAAGYSAVGHLSPFHGCREGRRVLRDICPEAERAVQRIGSFREAVGNEVDLCLELHRRMKPAEAIDLARDRQFHPSIYEDPTIPDNFRFHGAYHIAEQYSARNRAKGCTPFRSARCC